MNTALELLKQAREEAATQLAQIEAAILALNGGKRRGRPPGKQNGRKQRGKKA